VGEWQSGGVAEWGSGGVGEWGSGGVAPCSVMRGGVRDGRAGRLGPCLATAEPLPLELQGDDRLLERLQGAPENERNEERGRPGPPPLNPARGRGISPGSEWRRSH